MLRRDEFLRKLGTLNSGDYLNAKVLELEAFVDSELSKIENYTFMANTNDQGSSSGNIETVNNYEPTIVIHTDINVKSGSSGTTGIGYKIWGEELQYSSGVTATSTPWNDVILADTSFTGWVVITLPDNTNKNVAKLLADKYRTTSMNGATPLGGFWGTNDVVLTYDYSLNKLYMKFTLNTP